MSDAPIRAAITRLDHARDLPLPYYTTDQSAGMDLAAAVPSDMEIAPGGRALIPTGFAAALPPGYEAQVRPRSGLALKHGITVLNSPGTVDADYRGEISVILANMGEAPFTVSRGMRIAQLVIAPVTQVSWDEVAELPESERGTGGYGSTGLASEA
jgi:dUTP pyrophosphatase